MMLLLKDEGLAQDLLNAATYRKRFTVQARVAVRFPEDRVD